MFSKGVEMLNSAVDCMSSSRARKDPLDVFTMVVFATAVLLMFVPFETSQLICIFAGAVAYAIVVQASKSAPKKTKSIGACDKYVEPISSHKPVKNRSFQPKARSHVPKVPQAPSANPTYIEVYKPSCKPVMPVSFNAKGWDQQAEELLSNIRPTPDGDVVLQKLVQHVKEVICNMIPEAEVVGLASGDIMRGRAFAVAVPEIDIIVTVGNAALNKSLQESKSSQKSPKGNKSLKDNSMDPRKMQKSAIRACTDLLVSSGGFKFRRSAFKGSEPKVTLLAPSTLGFHDEAIAVDFSVNAMAPIYNAALINACASIDPSIKDLLLLVKRWAKDRGVCHAAKGHLPPYQWSLLTIYFLQVWTRDGNPILPPLGGQEIAPGLMVRPPAKASGEVSAQSFNPNTKMPTAGTLFKEFLQFYCKSFDWRNEAVSVRLGKRAPPSLHLPLHVLLGKEDGSAPEIALSIEDPFHNGRNLGDCMSSTSLERLREELHRANELCYQDAPLASLLELWAPAECSGSGGGANDTTEVHEDGEMSLSIDKVEGM